MPCNIILNFTMFIFDQGTMVILSLPFSLLKVYFQNYKHSRVRPNRHLCGQATATPFDSFFFFFLSAFNVGD